MFVRDRRSVNVNKLNSNKRCKQKKRRHIKSDSLVANRNKQISMSDLH